MSEGKNITLTDDQFAELLGKVGQSARPTPQTNRMFDGSMASKVDQDRIIRANEFNRKLVQTKDMVQVSIPSIYSEYIGHTVTVTVNGNTVKCPVNDEPFMISKAHNHQLQKKLRHINTVKNRSNQQAPTNMGTVGDWGMVTGI